MTSPSSEKQKFIIPTWVYVLLFGVIFSSLGGLQLIKTGVSETEQVKENLNISIKAVKESSEKSISNLKEDVQELKEEQKKLVECVQETEKTLERVQTVLIRVEKVLDR